MCVFELYYCFIPVPCISFCSISLYFLSYFHGYFFFRKICVERVILQLYNTPFSEQTSLFKESCSKRPVQSDRNPWISWNYPGKGLGPNHAGNSLLRPFRFIFRKSLEFCIATEETYFKWFLIQNIVLSKLLNKMGCFVVSVKGYDLFIYVTIFTYHSVYFKQLSLCFVAMK